MNDTLQNILRRTQSSATGFSPAAQDEEYLYTNIELPADFEVPQEENPVPTIEGGHGVIEQMNRVVSVNSAEADQLIAELLSQQRADTAQAPQNLEQEDPAMEATRIVEEAMEESMARNPEAPIYESPENPTIQRTSDYFIQSETTRFSSAEWFQKTQEQSVIIAGVGGIGSWCAFLIAKLHPSIIYLYDMDTVEVENLAGQLYSESDFGRPKVYALENTIREYTGYHGVSTFQTEYTEDSMFEKVMICGFDNMQARKTFFNRWKFGVSVTPDEHKKECLYIDGRLTANELQIFCIVGDDEYSINKYESEYLFLDSEASEEICSFKQTAYMANMIGGLMTNLFVNFCANLCNPVIPRALPFKTVYISEHMFFKLEN